MQFRPPEGMPGPEEFSEPRIYKRLLVLVERLEKGPELFEGEAKVALLGAYDELKNALQAEQYGKLLLASDPTLLVRDPFDDPVVQQFYASQQYALDKHRVSEILLSIRRQLSARAEQLREDPDEADAYVSKVNEEISTVLGFLRN